MKEMKMDFSRITNKPFFVKNLTWTTSNAAWSHLDTIAVPLGLLLNPLIKKPFESSALYRTRICVYAQVSGTPMHQGMIVMAAMPAGFGSVMTGAGNNAYVMASYMCAPHVFLNANESTSVCLEFPFYAPTKLLRSDLGATGGGETSNVSGNYFGDLRLTVVNPLSAPTSGSTSLTVSLHVMFKDSEFYVPHIDPTFTAESQVYDNSSSISAWSLAGSAAGWATRILDQSFSYGKQVLGDYIDKARNLITKYTGLHNPNISTPKSGHLMVIHNRGNTVDSTTYYEKLDPFFNYDRVVNEPIFNTDVDEMSIKNIICKPAYLGTFSVSTTDTSGKVLWSRPISPLQTTYGGNAFITPLEVLYSATGYWRGSLRLHIQAVMSNFHFAKLLIAKNYSPVLSQLGQTPALADIPNLITDTLEFSAGGQVQTIELPYYTPLENVPNTLDYVTNTFQVGMYYIYLLQPLVLNGAVSTSVSFNVYVSAGPDFTYYGFAKERSSRVIFGPNVGAEEEEFVPESNDCPDVQAPVPVNPQECVLNDTCEETDVLNESIMRPIVSIRDILRRLLPVHDFRSTGSTDYTIPLRVTELLGLNSPLDTGQYDPVNTSVFSTISGLFRGFTGGVKCKIVVSGPVSMSVYYLPPEGRQGAAPGKVGSVRGTCPYIVGTAANDVSFNGEIHSKFSVLGPGAKAVVPVPLKFISDITPQTASTGINRQIFEFSIPNYSPISFVGDIQYRNSNVASYLSNDLGTILLIGNTQAAADAFNVKVYAGLTDESRFGFQTICFPRNMLVAGSPQGINTTTGVPTSTGFITYGLQTGNAPKCYVP